MSRSFAILIFRRQEKEGARAGFGLHKVYGLAAPLYAPSWPRELEGWPAHPGLEGSLEAESAGSKGRLFSGFGETVQ